MTDKQGRGSASPVRKAMKTLQTKDAASQSGASKLQWSGRLFGLAGAVTVLALSGIAKFTKDEVEGLKPVLSGSPLLAWMKPTLGDAGGSYAIGGVELAAAALLAASPWSARAGVAGGALGTLTFATTSSLLLSKSPSTWEAKSGGAPFPSSWGLFLMKDLALLGATLGILGTSLNRPAAHNAQATGHPR